MDTGGVFDVGDGDEGAFEMAFPAGGVEGEKVGVGGAGVGLDDASEDPEVAASEAGGDDVTGAEGAEADEEGGAGGVFGGGVAATGGGVDAGWDFGGGVKGVGWLVGWLLLFAALAEGSAGSGRGFLRDGRRGLGSVGWKLGTFWR